MVAEDEALVGGRSQVALHPEQLVGPGGGVVPRGGGEDVGVEVFGQKLKRLFRTVHLVHQGEEARIVPAPRANIS